MNVVPKLLDNPSWATIAAFNGTELMEFGMFVFMSIALVAGVAYGMYSALRGNRG